MSEYYKNPTADALMLKIEKDYIYAMHRLSKVKGISIDHKNIQALDDISVMEKSRRSDALKEMFVQLNNKKDK
jgi:hypothetical protein